MMHAWMALWVWVSILCGDRGNQREGGGQPNDLDWWMDGRRVHDCIWPYGINVVNNMYY